MGADGDGNPCENGDDDDGDDVIVDAELLTSPMFQIKSSHFPQLASQVIRSFVPLIYLIAFI